MNSTGTSGQRTRGLAAEHESPLYKPCPKHFLGEKEVCSLPLLRIESSGGEALEVCACVCICMHMGLLVLEEVRMELMCQVNSSRIKLYANVTYQPEHSIIVYLGACSLP